MIKKDLIIQNRYLKQELLRMKQNSNLILASDQLKLKIWLEIYLKYIHKRWKLSNREDIENNMPCREYQIRLCRQIKDNDL